MNPNDPAPKTKALTTGVSGTGAPASQASSENGVPPPEIPDYELIKRIGEGSYGEVWLARSVMGTCRAVKIVHRHAFQSDRPFEREFEGIRKFEPVSQTNECQLKIFHVGRRNGYFYYVMELADDAAEPRQVERESELKVESSAPTQLSAQVALNYVPKTLRSELQRRGRLPVEESLDFSLKLTQALSHLHRHGLVHRDIKPSNIIFVNGLPKLADIGLVADTEGTLTFVGTEGYLPPEGPGKPSADIFSLGKVLYEISTGHDRNQFPELPTRWDSAPEREAFAELNEVIIKACAADIRQRYESAEEMYQDLLLLRSGRSLQQVRRGEQLWATTRRVAAGVAVGCVVLALLLPWWQRPRETNRPLPVRLAVDDARFWPVPFMPQQFDFSPDGERIVFTGINLVSIWEAKTRVTRRLELRGIGDWKPANGGAVALARWAPDNRRFVFQAQKQVGGTEDDPIWTYAFFIVNADTGEARQIGPEFPEAEKANDLCWRPGGEAVTFVSTPRRLTTLSLNGERTAWRDSNLSGTKAIRLGEYSADGAWLLVSTDNGNADNPEDRDVWAVPHLGGNSQRLTQGAGRDAHPIWGPDGESIYYVSDGGRSPSETWGIWKIGVDRPTPQPKGVPSEVFVRSGSKFLHPKFVVNGRALAYAVMEPKTDVWVGEWDALEKATIAVRGQDPVLSPDGQTIYFVGERPDQRGVFAINRSGDKRSLRKVTDLTPLITGLTSSGLNTSPDGQILALLGYNGSQHGVFVMPTDGGEPRLVEELPKDESALPVWSPDGNWLAYALSQRLIRTSRDGRVRETLATLPRWQGWSVRWSSDGTHIAAFGSTVSDLKSEDSHVYVVAVADKILKKLTPDTENQWKEGLEWHRGGQYLTYFSSSPERLSAQIRRAYLDGRPTDLMIPQSDHWDYLGVWAPDGRRFFFTSSALGRGEKENIHLYDAQTGQITHSLWGGRSGALPRWSRDGRTAVWAVSDTLRYFEVVEDFTR